MGHIFFIMGISGAGKGTLIRNLKALGERGLYFPLSYKTREIRSTETNHVDANFISRQDFLDGIEMGEFLEYAILYDGEDYYGTKFEDVIDNGIEKGKTVIKELDILGLKRLIKKRPGLDSSYTTIFLNIPIDKLRERIESRGAIMNEDEFQRRLNTAIVEEQEAREICHHVLDATKKPEDILTDVLKIIQNTIV